MRCPACQSTRIATREAIHARVRSDPRYAELARATAPPTVAEKMPAHFRFAMTGFVILALAALAIGVWRLLNVWRTGESAQAGIEAVSYSLAFLGMMGLIFGLPKLFERTQAFRREVEYWKTEPMCEDCHHTGLRSNFQTREEQFQDIREADKRRAARELPDRRRTAQENPGDFQAQFELGLTLRDLGSYEEALAHFDRLLNEHPGRSADVRVQRGIIRMYRAEYDEALVELDQAVKARPTWVMPYWQRAAVHELQGDLVAARDELQLALGHSEGVTERTMTEGRISALGKK